MNPVALTSGEVLPARLPAMREALATGEVGVDGVVAVAGPLLSCAAGTAEVLAADEELAATACGEGADAAPPACAEDLRAMATVWAMYLDQDGAEPREDRAMRKRGFTFGMCRDGLVPGRGNFLPEVAAELQLLFDSELNPKVDGAPMPSGPVFDETDAETVDPCDPDAPLLTTADRRTRAQKQHDVLAGILNRVAASGSMPTLGGSAPTLVVSVRAEDLESGRGFAHIGGVAEPDLARCRPARRVLRSGAAGCVRRHRPDRAARHAGTGVRPPPAACHQPSRRWLRHPGLPRQSRVVRNPPRGRALARRPDAHRQRGSPLLAPSPHVGDKRVGDSDEPGHPRSARAFLVGRVPKVATRHQVAGADARTSRAKDMKPPTR